MTQALTIGEIARRLAWPTHRVDYLIRSRGIEPEMRAGNLRVFPETIIDRLRRERASQLQPAGISQ
jgi:DNA-binding transcriptional MerR regulator